MATINSAFQRDANRVPITLNGITLTKEITYSALTTGAVGATTLFTVTGVVAVKLFGVCSVNLAGSGTIEAGIAGNTAALLAQTTGTDIDANEIWVDTGPATVEALPAQYILNGTNIIQTIGTDTLTGGTLTYYCLWSPISSDGNIV